MAESNGKRRSAVIYCRVSTGRQAREGVSLDAQLESCTALCQRKNWQIVGHFEDSGVSAWKNKKRNGLTKASKAVCESNGVLVVYSLTRLGRSVPAIYRLCDSLKECGADVTSVSEAVDTTTAMGRAFFGMIAVHAQLESDLISERVTAANAHTVRKLGYRTQGKQPAGWTIENGRKVEVPAEQELIGRVAAIAKGLSLRQAARELERQEVPTIHMLRGLCDGPPKWNYEKVRKMLLRAK